MLEEGGRYKVRQLRILLMKLVCACYLIVTSPDGYLSSQESEEDIKRAFRDLASLGMVGS